MSTPGNPKYNQPPPDHGNPPYGFNPPPYSPGPSPVAPATVVIQPSGMPPLGPEPARIVCPSCRANITTRLEYETTTKTHMMCVIMCIFGLWPCCLIPYCMDTCKNTNHHCPSCGAYLGQYKR